jgi:hypothetical protein
MNATELFHKDGKSANVFYCGKCRNVAASQSTAEQCCNNYICTRCGNDTGSRCWIVCDECRSKEDAEKERARFEKSEKLTTWDGWVFCEGTGNDGFSESLSDFYDNWSDEHDEGGTLPEYVWACTENYFVNASLDDITERLAGDAYEDWDPDTLKGLDELRSALQKFNEANADVCSYHPDYTKAILIKAEHATRP